MRAKFENGEFGNSFLLGDGCYPCCNYLMTPLLNPNSEAEKRYKVWLNTSITNDYKLLKLN